MTQASAAETKLQFFIDNNVLFKEFMKSLGEEKSESVTKAMQAIDHGFVDEWINKNSQQAMAKFKQVGDFKQKKFLKNWNREFADFEDYVKA